MTESERLIIRLDEQYKHILEEVAKIRADLKTDYVTKGEFSNVRAIVFGAVAIVLVGFMAALVKFATLQ